MTGSSLLALIDDIATTLDDVALLTKIAAKKTTGVLGDDLALNAEQVAGVAADRELPVVYAVAKGSALNKLILIPTALLISQLLPWLIVPLLMVGGAYLCFEGFEKVFHKFFHKHDDTPKKEKAVPLTQTAEPADVMALEKEKVKGAVRTDFILSAEIVVITLGTVAQESLAKQALVLLGIATLMTIGVYGLVALIVKLDDMGFYYLKQTSNLKKQIGKLLLGFAPLLMKFLGIAGTVAMFMVGGGIISHNIHPLHDFASSLHFTLSSAIDVGLGLFVGGAVYFCISIFNKLKTVKT